MNILLKAGMAAALFATPAAAQDDSQQTEEQPTEVMVLGVYHFANPGLDMINVDVDDVLTPERQVELQALSDALAEWAPTRILIEAQPETEDLHMRSYRSNPQDRIREDRNEHFQIGYRLAMQLGHDDVYGFDEHSGEGEPDYFPMDAVQAYAAENDLMGQFGTIVGQAQAMVEGMTADDQGCSIANNLLAHNDSDQMRAAHSMLYYGFLNFGDAENQPGAELNSYWYMRNAKMFAKIDLISEPGERVLVIVGSGHKYWLDHFAQMTPGYASVDPTPWLEIADDGRCN